jgi:hypothetical protein
MALVIFVPIVVNVMSHEWSHSRHDLGHPIELIWYAHLKKSIVKTM